MNPLRRFTIATKLTVLFVLFAALILAGVSTLAYLSGRAALEQAVTSDLQSTANEKQAAFEQWLADRLKLVVTITEFPAYRARVNSLINDNLDDAARKMLQDQTAQALAGFTGSNGNYAEMMILDAQQGQVIVSTQVKSVGQFKEDRPYFIEGLKGSFVQNILYSLNQQAPSMLVSAPMKGDDGRVIAVLAARLRLDEMNEIISRRTGERQTDDAFLVNLSNLIVTQPRLMNDPAVLQRGVYTEPVKHCLAGTSGAIAADDYRGIPVLAVYRWMPNRQLCLIVKMDQAEAFAPSIAFGQTIIWIALATLGLASFLGFGLSRTITRPIRMLQDGVMRFGRGERSVRLSETANDEIGVLAHEFNHMAKSLAEQETQLRDRAVDLERHVTERTTALRASEERYRGLFENMAEGYAYCKMIFENGQAQDWIYLAVNNTFETLTGLKNVTGKRVSDVIPGIRETDQELFTRYARVALTGQHEKFEMFVQALQAWYSISVYSPEKEFFVAVFDVITERKHAEEALRQSEASFRVLFENHPHPMWVYDLKTLAFLEVNDAAVDAYGFSREEFLGMSLVDIRPPEDVARLLKNVAQERPALQHSGEWRHRLKDGRIIDVEITSHKIEFGRHDAALVVALNVTERKRAEEALRVSEARYHSLIETQTELIARSDLSGHLTFVNEAYCQMFGKSQNELIGNPFTPTILPEDLPISLNAIQAIQSLPYRKTTVTRHLTPRGIHWIEWENSAVLDDQNNIIELQSTGREITARKQAEEALRKSQNLLQAIIDNSSSLIYVLDTEGRFLLLNRALENLFGIPREKLIGLSREEFMPQAIAQAHRANDLQVIRKQKAIVIEEMNEEPDGTHTYYSVKFPLMDPVGAIYAIAGMSTDITPRKKAEQEIETLNRRLQILISAIQELASARDLETVMAGVRTYARKLTGADGSTFVLREGDQCYYADEDALAPLWKGQRFPISACISGWVMLNKQPVVIQDIYSDPRIPIDAYKSTFVQSMVMVPIRTDDPLGAIGNYWARHYQPTEMELQLVQTLANAAARAVENVRLLQELEQRVEKRTAELSAANKELEAFSYSVSHDLRAPLRGIDGFSRILLEEHAPQLVPEAQRYLQIVRNNAVKMGQLIDDLLDFSRLSRQPINKQPVDCTKMVRQILQDLHAEQKDRHIELTTSDLPICQADPALLKQVWINLLSNALKFTRKREMARIEIGSVGQGGNLTYYVRDNGVGFDMRYVDKLFGVFQRLHRAEDFEGTGVGLAIVQRVIYRHGGRVWAESEENNGATFYFSLEGGNL